MEEVASKYPRVVAVTEELVSFPDPSVIATMELFSEASLDRAIFALALISVFVIERLTLDWSMEAETLKSALTIEPARLNLL